jgi:hypothetical protein
MGVQHGAGVHARREVLASSSHGTTCDLGAGIVDINGTTYWATVARDIVSFDLDNDFVTPTYHRGLLDGTFLTVVHGMLGLVSRDTLSVMNNIEVWVKWKPHFLHRWYSLHVSPSCNLAGQRPRGHQHVTRPHFVQDSGHVLT